MNKTIINYTKQGDRYLFQLSDNSTLNYFLTKDNNGFFLKAVGYINDILFDWLGADKKKMQKELFNNTRNTGVWPYVDSIDKIDQQVEWIVSHYSYEETVSVPGEYDWLFE